jgi:hypothetical protein
MFESPLTFGIEFESGKIQYDTREGYDGKKIFEEGKLNVTLEFFSNHMPRQCFYNIEFVLGVYEVPRLKQFLLEKRYYIDDIREDLHAAKRFLSSHAGNLRWLVDKTEEKADALYSDCSLSEPSAEDERYAYAPYVDGMAVDGDPQVTLGVNYSFFLPLLQEYDRSSTFLEMFSYVVDDLEFPESIEESLVIRNFIAVLCYYCYQTSESFIPDMPYFKALFTIKPRTNPAKSYALLKEKYPSMENVILQLYQKLSQRYQTTIAREEFKLQVIEQLLNIQLKEGDTYNKVMNKIFQKKGYPLVLLEMMQVDLFYLLRRIFRPKNVVKVIEVNPVKTDRSVEEGAIYRYIEEDMELLNSDQYLLRYEVIEGAYAALDQLPTLSVKDGLLHASHRLEVFEWIPTDTNVILENRAALEFAEMDKVNLDTLPDFMERFLDRTNSVMRRYLIKTGLMKRERPKTIVSSLLM